ncbi:Izh3 protein [Starmerella bacillaris]|uniref:Izh3 protein n=1 Tax=Starmerella bacillaris TaxID=1247836 RepID=A0AAV5RC34_STABA|nr:Izh3 protein [Starmerella bacillaris]
MSPTVEFELKNRAGKLTTSGSIDSADVIREIEEIEEIEKNADDDFTNSPRYTLLHERLEYLLQSVDHLDHKPDISDKQRDQDDHFISFVTQVRKSSSASIKERTDAVVKYVESTTTEKGFMDLDFMEKFARAIEHIELALENSRLSKSIQHALSCARVRRLNIEELPVPWRENPHIIKGYRFCGSSTECWHSIMSFHNETTNIWTHLIGALLFVGLGVFHLPTTHAWQNGSWIDRLPMLVFIACAIQCLLCSVIWHSFCHISHLHTKRRMVCFDYTGIVLCIAASILTTEYTILKCHPVAQIFYMSITLACSVFGVIMSWHPNFDSTGARAMRAMFFVTFALFGGLGGLHAAYYRGLAETLSYYVPVIKSLACYGTGVIFYASLFPEKYIKGRFDYCGMSHNIWHLFVVAGIYYHYQAMIEIFERALSEVC